MKILLLLFAWFMLRFVHHRYTISHPKGIFYSDVSDYVTAFMYQPVINLVLVVFILIALSLVYTIFFLTILHIKERKLDGNFINLLQLSLALYLIIVGFMYFKEFSILFLLTILYLFLQSYFRNRRRKIKRYWNF